MTFVIVSVAQTRFRHDDPCEQRNQRQSTNRARVAKTASLSQKRDQRSSRDPVKRPLELTRGYTQSLSAQICNANSNGFVSVRDSSLAQTIPPVTAQIFPNDNPCNSLGTSPVSSLTVETDMPFCLFVSATKRNTFDCSGRRPRGSPLLYP